MFLQLWMCTLCVPGTLGGQRRASDHPGTVASCWEVARKQMWVFGKNRTLSIESSHFSSFGNLDFYHMPLPTSLLPHSVVLETNPQVQPVSRSKGTMLRSLKKKFQRAQEQDLQTHTNQVQWCSKNKHKPPELEMHSLPWPNPYLNTMPIHRGLHYIIFNYNCFIDEDIYILEMLLIDLIKCWSQDWTQFSCAHLLSIQYVICQGESFTTVRDAHLAVGTANRTTLWSTACYLVVTCQIFVEWMDEFGAQ